MDAGSSQRTLLSVALRFKGQSPRLPRGRCAVRFSESSDAVEPLRDRSGDLATDLDALAAWLVHVDAVTGPRRVLPPLPLVIAASAPAGAAMLNRCGSV